MGRENVAVYALNRGLLSPLALARTDISRTALSAETLVNFIPRVLGSMSLRPGFKYIASTDLDNVARYHQFIFSQTDTAMLEFTDTVLRVFVGDVPITRPSTATTISNTTFDTNLTSWTDADDSGALSTWYTGGYMSLVGTGVGGAAAKRYQTITVAGGDLSKEHGIVIKIGRGRVTLRVGSTVGGDEYIEETTLGEGEHRLSLTPTGNFTIQFSSYNEYASLVDSCDIEASGIVSWTSPYAEADLDDIRIEQSGDVMYIACYGYQRYKIERRATRSWSIVKYQPEDGAFRNLNISPITITPSAVDGDVTLTASAPLFQAGHAGSLFKLYHTSQLVNATITAQNTFTNEIEVTGLGAGRVFSVILTGTWAATVTLQYSIGAPGAWVDYDTYTTNQSIVVDDGLDNQIIYYRIGVKTGEFTSGTLDATLAHARGAQYGIMRIYNVASATSASASVLKEMGSIDPTADWYEEVYSDYRGHPAGVSLYEGRLYWAGSNRIVGSVSDAYESYDNEIEGDSGPINRTIGFGAVDEINWIQAQNQLLLGTAGSEIVARSTSEDEPLTPTNFNLKETTTQGSAKVDAIKVDNTITYIQKSKTRPYQLVYSYADGNHVSQDIAIHVPEIGEPEIIKLAVQRKPDTRIHCVRADGKVAMMVFDKAEEVVCWLVVETDGEIEDVIVMPGDVEDEVYYVVKRTVNAATKRYLEKWAKTNDAVGATYVYSGSPTTVITDLPYVDGITVTVYDSGGTKVENLVVADSSVTLSSADTYALLVPSVHLLADSFIEYDGASTATITGLTHLEGETVVARGDGIDLGTYTVASGQITLTQAVENCVVGLPYTAKFKSTKLAYAHNLGTGLSQRKVVNRASIIMRDVFNQGIQIGGDFINMDNLPGVQDGKVVDVNHIWQDYDKDMEPFLKKHGTDVRFCLRAAAPNPCTVLAVVLAMEAHDAS